MQPPVKRVSGLVRAEHMAALVCALFTLPAHSVHAQPTFTIRGTVVDSVAGRPLAGATVQLGTAESARAPWTVTTDAAGRYEIRQLPAGRYVIGFYHDALTALGLDAPSRHVELGGSATIDIDLAIPSGATIRTLRCGLTAAFRQGMLVGFVRDAESRSAVPGASAVISWRALALDSANYHVVNEQATATIEPDGAVLACGLPVDAPLELRVTAPGHRTVAGTVVTVPPNEISRLDLLLVDSALTAGESLIRGRVLRESGKPVPSGRVVIASLGKDVPIQDGAFNLGGVPAGSWVAEARVIGVEPQAVLVNAVESEVTIETITVANAAQILDAVTVVGKPDRNLRVLDEVLRRSRIGTGTTFLPGHPALRSALHVADPLREARGFQYFSPTQVFGRQHGMGRCTAVAVYVDDVRVPDGLVNVDAIVPVNQILAIEAWPDIAYAPVQYRGPVGSSGGMMGAAAGSTAGSASGSKGGKSGASSGFASRSFETPASAGGGGTASRPDAAPCALILVWTKRPF